MRKWAGLAAVLLVVAGCTPDAGNGSRSGTDAVDEVHRSEVPAAPTVERLPSAEPKGSEGWRMRQPAAHREVEAYASRVSGVPGVTVGLMVSTADASFRVQAWRIGSYARGTGLLVWRSGRHPGQLQARPSFAAYETRTVVARWRPALDVDTTGWSPGFYVFKVTSSRGWQTHVPYVVASPSAAGTVALVAPFTTYQAYNGWGGYSLYEGAGADRRSWVVSFDRPWDVLGEANNFRRAALPIIIRAEALGVPLSYFANVDLHHRPGSLAGARGYVSMGHDEYWTPAMRRAVERARDGGTNLAFLGANTMYWRVRLTGSTMVGYRDDAWRDPWREARPTEATSRFRDAPHAWPEHDLVGMQYECYPVDADYRVMTPRWWGFRGTGVRRGDAFAGLVGPESDRVYPDASSPRPMQVLSHTSFTCRGTTTSAQSVYYTTRSGAGVFSAGTLRWGCAIIDLCEHPLGARTSRFVRTVTDTVVRTFARGPVGRRWPAVHNVDEFDLPTTNGVTAS